MRRPTRTKPNTNPMPLESTSPIYDHIMEDFLARAGKEDAISPTTMRRLRAAFEAGPPKPAVLIDAFGAHDELD
jgi:hypothetical protein